MTLQENLDDLKRSNNEMFLALTAMEAQFLRLHDEIYDVKTGVTIVQENILTFTYICSYPFKRYDRFDLK